MTAALPDWALRKAERNDCSAVKSLRRRGILLIEWPDLKALREWARAQSWPTPWFDFKGAFLTRMLGNDADFDLAIVHSGVVIQVNQDEHTIPACTIREFDELYQEQLDDGRRIGWATLVAELREIRRAVEAGVLIRIEGEDASIKSWQAFYDWAHGRYPVLEEGSDSWIGDDNS
jgi:hypothetical protein